MRRRIFSILFLLVFVLLGGWALVAAGANLSREWSDLRSDQVLPLGSDIWEKRMEPLREYLPERGIIGYLAEDDLPGAPAGAQEDLEELLLTQYFLAPRIIVKGAGYAWVIGNFGKANFDMRAVEDAYGLRLRKEFSYGIFLFERNQE
jgi:hypothetical protein